jgi:S-adenosylmethionine:tRNA ribosyltransferase-isomerase
MQLSDFHYEVPDTLIADHPPAMRGESRLLALNRTTGAIDDRMYGDCVDYFDAGDVLVINDTKVIKARLIAHKINGAKRELVLVEKHGEQDDWHRHRVLYRRSLKVGDELMIGPHAVTVDSIEGDGVAIIRSELSLLDIAEEFGSVPLPPYMRRQSSKEDEERYQTVFAREIGSVAAPTASLNMTDETIARLRAKGVVVVYATLHVGLGTFLPIRVDDVTKHHMHKEYFQIPKSTVEAIQKAKAEGKAVTALGTTITRTLEYAHDHILNQAPADIEGEADIFMYPGYKFKLINRLMTNFHAPESTVLMLTAAFAGWDKLRPAYEHAVAEQYMFFSYGDSMIIY